TVKSGWVWTAVGTVRLGLPAGPAQWLLRLTPAAPVALQQTLVAYPQVDGAYLAGVRVLSARPGGRPVGALRVHRRGAEAGCCPAGSSGPHPLLTDCCSRAEATTVP